MDYGIDSNRTLELQDFVGIVYIPSMDYGIDSNRTRTSRPNWYTIQWDFYWAPSLRF